ncbi:hydrolase [Streptomyces sp. NBC_00102]|uniref:COG1470 family protein n=1 Tax=Streptomyces sp. NBC_00102 TaxID=2975652 RepID=UPI0022502A9B|nr:hydrolase [Streptomyces sp. NBC_00102]MCX5398694.1 hydrolase [Streptomyces sp. NBC_00102]
MSLWTSLEPASATVDPGSSTTVRLRLRNTGDVVDEYRFEAVGDIAPWTTVEPPTLRLFPGTTGTVELKFAPPRTPDATAGPNPYAIRITPTEHPEATTVPEGNLTITPFTELRAELVPPTVKGRFRGRPKLAIDNLGNTKLTASLGGHDNGDQLTYDLRPSNTQIPPGRAAFITTTLKPRKIIWFGPKEQRPYTLTVQRSGTTPLPVEGTFVQRGFLPRWLATLLGILLALTITFLALWFGHKPTVASGTTEKLVEAGATLAPTPTPQATLAPPPVTAAPTTEAPQAEPTKEAKSGDSGGDKEATPSKAPEVTAATLVNRMAKDDPSGRHICYRAFIKGEGWTDPVCDGAMAGNTRNVPITAVNTAVAGVGSSQVQAAVHNPESTDGTPAWTSWSAWIPDGKDNYMGSTDVDAPVMAAFGITISSGQVCQNVRYVGKDWYAEKCKDTKDGFNFAGSWSNDVTLEALLLRVPASAQ